MRIEEKEYTKSIDFSIWKKVLPFLAPPKKRIAHGSGDELSVFCSRYYHAFVSASGH